jgi:hypothetical protein
LSELQAIHDALQNPITRARGRVVWRAGSKVREDRFEVAVKAVQQLEYATALKVLTQEFTIRPSIPEQPFDIE